MDKKGARMYTMDFHAQQSTLVSWKKFLKNLMAKILDNPPESSGHGKKSIESKNQHHFENQSFNTYNFTGCYN